MDACTHTITCMSHTDTHTHVKEKEKPKWVMREEPQPRTSSGLCMQMHTYEHGHTHTITDHSTIGIVFHNRWALLGPSWVGFMKSMWVAVSLDTLPSWREVVTPKLTSALLSIWEAWGGPRLTSR